MTTSIYTMPHFSSMAEMRDCFSGRTIFESFERYMNKASSDFTSNYILGSALKLFSPFESVGGRAPIADQRFADRAPSFDILKSFMGGDKKSAGSFFDRPYGYKKVEEAEDTGNGDDDKKTDDKKTEDNPPPNNPSPQSPANPSQPNQPPQAPLATPPATQPEPLTITTFLRDHSSPTGHEVLKPKIEKKPVQEKVNGTDTEFTELTLTYDTKFQNLTESAVEPLATVICALLSNEPNLIIKIGTRTYSSNTNLKYEKNIDAKQLLADIEKITPKPPSPTPTNPTPPTPSSSGTPLDPPVRVAADPKTLSVQSGAPSPSSKPIATHRDLDIAKEVKVGKRGESITAFKQDLNGNIEIRLDATPISISDIDPKTLVKLALKLNQWLTKYSNVIVKVGNVEFKPGEATITVNNLKSLFGPAEPEANPPSTPPGAEAPAPSPPPDATSTRTPTIITTRDLEDKISQYEQQFENTGLNELIDDWYSSYVKYNPKQSKMVQLSAKLYLMESFAKKEMSDVLNAYTRLKELHNQYNQLKIDEPDYAEKLKTIVASITTIKDQANALFSKWLESFKSSSLSIKQLDGEILKLDSSAITAIKVQFDLSIKCNGLLDQTLDTMAEYTERLKNKFHQNYPSDIGSITEERKKIVIEIFALWQKAVSLFENYIKTKDSFYRPTKEDKDKFAALTAKSS